MPTAWPGPFDLSIRSLLAFVILWLCPGPGARVTAAPDSHLLEKLASPRWPEVERASIELADLQARAVPLLLDALDDRSQIPLEQTGDLIYPGARSFAGHGRVVDYELDWLGVRAGWVLEGLTFLDFGFRAYAVEASRPADRGASEDADRPASSMPDGLRPSIPGSAERWAEAVRRARSWWQEAATTWSRLRAVTEALDSASPERQSRALQWLRFGETSCDGLTPGSYESLVAPRVERLSRTADPALARQAKLLIEEGPSTALIPRAGEDRDPL